MKHFFMLWLVLLSAMVPQPGFAEGDMKSGMQQLGAGMYLEKIIQESATMKQILSPEVKAKMLGLTDLMKQKRQSGLSVKAVLPSEYLQVEFAIAEFDDLALLITMPSNVRGTEKQPYGLNLVEFPNNLSSVVAVWYPYLPFIESDHTLMEATAVALRDSVTARDWKEFVKYMNGANRKIGKLPQFLALWVEKMSSNLGPSGNGLLKGFDFAPQVDYVCSRSITDNLFVSLFRLDCTLAPAVAVVTFYVLEGNAIVANIDIQLGTTTMPYLIDMQKIRVTKRD